MYVKERKVIRMDVKSKRVEQGDATRASLVATARRLFGSHGYAATSLQAIVDAAGVTKGAFYHHFASKQEIFRHVFEDVQREIGRRAFVVHLDEEATRNGHAGSAAGIRDLSKESNEEVWNHLVRGCRTYLELHAEPEILRIVLIDGRAVLPWDEWHRVQSDHGVVLLRADLRRAMGRRIIRQVPLGTLATMLAGALHEACITVANAEDSRVAVAEAMEVTERFLAGLRAEEQPGQSR